MESALCSAFVESFAYHTKISVLAPNIVDQFEPLFSHWNTWKMCHTLTQEGGLSAMTAETSNSAVQIGRDALTKMFHGLEISIGEKYAACGTVVSDMAEGLSKEGSFSPQRYLLGAVNVFATHADRSDEPRAPRDGTE